MVQDINQVRPITQVVNVATVPHRSPFRYPGGKTWLVPYIRQWLASLPAKPVEFFEPFAGGAIVGLTVAFERYADHVTLVELDEQVAAVWQTILGGEGEWLAEQIASFELTRENVEACLTEPADVLREKAFQTILMNRVNRGGIMAHGAGRMKHGDGKGMASRWYPKTLKKRILGITYGRDRITFVKGDGLEMLRRQAHRTDAVFFIDPPYTAGGKSAGSRLYNHSEIDHEELFAVANTLEGDFLMTYDNNEEVQALAQKHGFDMQPIAMKNTHNAKMTELLVGRDLDWIRPRYLL
ncbi:MAG: DNA adenine methylase [Anaerolineae bacterium]|nr:DNA adenine methylase [Anaerolineae bacterium]